MTFSSVFVPVFATTALLPVSGTTRTCKIWVAVVVMAAERLVYVTDEEPGISRRGRSRFRYVRQSTGKEVRDDRELERIRRLAIPPAWTDVWICADRRGHVQATGRDARGRKQYRYHAAFRQRRERRKFHQLPAFGHSLARLRARVDDDLRSPSLNRARVLATIVSLLDLTHVRIGNEAYAQDNKSFGLTTLRCRHLDVDGNRLHLRFPGKNGHKFDVTCCDPRLARVVRRCQELPGQLLFQYVDDDGSPAPITSNDVNDYLQSATELDITAKTFRTWGATVLAAEQLSELDPPSSEREASIALNAALEVVAQRLGHTVAICRSSYVHPVVLDAFRDGTLAERWAAGPRRAAGGLSAPERKLLALLPAP
jgi:DNA topoisomerase-1